MYRTRFPFLALMLVLLVSACSRTPENLSTPSLEPQFGTADEDYGVDVALASTGGVYALSYTYHRGSPYTTLSSYTVYLQRYDNNGNSIWRREVTTASCHGCDTPIEANAVYTDASQNVYVWVSKSYDVPDEELTRRYSILYKYDSVGNFIGDVGGSPHCLDYDYVDHDFCSIDLAVDKGGTFYTARSGDGYGHNDNFVYESVVTKGYEWERPSTVGVLKGIAVSSTGNVFVVGSSGISRYSSSGTLNWTKSGGGDDITVSGSSVYVRKGNTIRKHDSSGKQLWSRAQSGLSEMVIADMTADGNGNVYLAGRFARTSSDQNAFYRKVNAKGSVVWTKTFGTSKYDDARGIATLNGSEIYATGSTEGTLSHPNRGGSDGYLRKMDGSGNRVWTR